MARKNKKNSQIIIFIAIAILIVSSITLFFVSRSMSNMYKHIRRLDVRFEVGDAFGVNLDRTDLIDFGMIPPGASSIGRMVSVTNPYEVPILVTVRFTGDAKEYLLVPPEQIIYSNESQNVTIWLSVPKNASLGNYSGKAIFQFNLVNG